VAFVSIVLEDKKQRRRGAELLIILALNFASLGKNNKDDDELSSTHCCRGSGSFGKYQVKGQCDSCNMSYVPMTFLQNKDLDFQMSFAQL
jgi:hypothetical protein